jgi:hypothetical protein
MLNALFKPSATRRILVVASLVMLCAALLASSKPAPGKAVTIVDQGSFGIFQNGQRIATETFTIRQYPDSNVTSSELRGQAGAEGPIDQTSEMTLLPDGSLSRYEWKQLTPVRSSAVVEPNDQFLTMHVMADGKTTDQAFFLTQSAFVLDDFFFYTREVLLWRYLASSCKPRPGGDGCDLERTRFAILIPRRHTSSQVFIEFKGYDNTPLNGRPQRLRHFLMQTEGADWHLWLDPDQKLVRISIPDTNTEILRQEK